MGAFSPDAPINTFVVRFWREWSVTGPRWRGRINHVQSGASAGFLELEEMLDVIRSFGVMARKTRQRDDINPCKEAGNKGNVPGGAEVEVLSEKERNQREGGAME